LGCADTAIGSATASAVNAERSIDSIAGIEPSHLQLSLHPTLADRRQSCDVAFWYLASFRCAAKFGSYWTHSGHDAMALAGSSPLLNFFGKKNSFPI
jgi:hypothetical protein